MRMLDLFENRSVHPTGKQLHFDERQTLLVEFTCRPFFLGDGEYVFGIQMRVGPNELHSIQNIKGFLTEIGQQEPFEYAPGLIYAQELYSFPSETDEVLQLLMKSQRVTNEYVLQEDILLIAASDWEQLLSLLTKVSAVRFMQDEILYEGVQFGSELPLSFEFDEANKTNYQLNVKGLTRILVFKAYGYAFSEGKLYKLPPEECNRLAELKEMLEQSGKHEISHFREPNRSFYGEGHTRVNEAWSCTYIRFHFEKNGRNATTGQAVFRPSQAPNSSRIGVPLWTSRHQSL